MLKSIGTIGAAMMLFTAISTSSKQFAKYQRVEAYEVRAGILVMPKYAEDGQVCEIELEERRYVDDKVNLESTLPPQGTAQLIDELAPPSERGPRTMGTRDRIVQSGKSTITFGEYKNISIQSYGGETSAPNPGNVVVLIRWKARSCKTQ